MSKASARQLRALARSKQKEARKMLQSKDPVQQAAGRTLLRQALDLRTRAAVEDALS